MPSSTPLGLRVLGGASGRREVVPLERAARLYANADPSVRPDIPAFLSAFSYPVDIKTHLESTGSTAGYSGPIGVHAVNFDIDRHDLAEAVGDARRLVAFVADRWSLDADDVLLSYSGSKGFHLSIPVSGIEPATDNHQTARRLASEVARAAGVTIDEGVYLPTQLWRAPNSRHPKTGLHKVRIDADDLLYIAPDAVRRLAVEPIPFDPPPPVVRPPILVDWARAATEVRRERELRLDRVGNAPRGGKINGLTWSFLRDGASEGERHRLLFSAAANLAEFGTVDELILAILTPTGLDTGLPPKEVARQIACGIDHARRNTEGGRP